MGGPRLLDAKLRRGLVGVSAPCAAALGLVLAACAPPSAPASASTAPGPEGAPLRYDDPASWLCRPDLPGEACHGNLDATELRPDGSRQLVPFVAAEHPAVDCFYVYPTVDVGMVPGNHDDFHDTAPMQEVVRSQAARFQSVCRLYAPLYRQVTIASYFEPEPERSRHFGIAFADVLAAFRWYLAHTDADRKIVLLGHSQGAEMVVRLLRAVFDDDPAMRSRLLVAMPIGGDVDVPVGKATGGTFTNIPPCADPDQLGCVVAYRTYRAGFPAKSWDGPPPSGTTSVCVNPAGFSTGPHNGKLRLTSAVLPTQSMYRMKGTMPGGSWATTPFLVLRDFYEAECVDGKAGFRYLAVEAAPAAGDTRTNPVDFDNIIWKFQLGLHLLDFQLAQGDLVEMVARRAGASASAR